MSQLAQSVQKLVDDLRRKQQTVVARRGTRGVQMAEEQLEQSPTEAPVAEQESAVITNQTEKRRTRAKRATRKAATKPNGVARKAAGKKEDFGFLNIRVPKAVRAAVVSRAKKEKASLNTVVGAALEQYLR